jgi:hypothetical protein
MTATEVVQRTEEKMRLLGPVLGRLQAELLQPLINRVFGILTERKVFRPAPEFMRDTRIDIEYVSPLAKAQRQGDIQSAMRLLELMQPMVQLDPSILDNIDADGFVRHLVKVLSVPATAVRGQDEIVRIRQQRAAEQQQQMEMQQAMQAAQAAGEGAPFIRAVSDQQ